jgi:hypothetical protein
MMRLASSTWLEMSCDFCLMRESPSELLATASPTICDLCTNELMALSAELSLMQNKTKYASI